MEILYGILKHSYGNPLWNPITSRKETFMESSVEVLEAILYENTLLKSSMEALQEILKDSYMERFYGIHRGILYGIFGILYGNA